MHVTQHAAELCALLVSDLYGELPSRIFATLLTKGRCTVSQLAQHTALTPRQLRHGLAVLFQQNLLYTRADPESRTTWYDANPDACYNLVRTGKVVEAVNYQFGPMERELVQNLLQFGHARVHDLSQAFASRYPSLNGKSNGSNGHATGDMIASDDDLMIVLARLIQADIIETVRPESFRNPIDVFDDIKQDVTKTSPGEKATKTKMEIEQQIANRWKSFRDQGKGVKRQLDQTRGSMSKRRRLHNGRAANGAFDDETVPQLGPNLVVRINYEKCLVDLRNKRLADFAAGCLGETTGEVYRTLLGLLTANTPRPRKDELIEEETGPLPTATTLDIFEHLDESVNVASGIGKVSKSNVDDISAEKVRPNAPQSDDESDDESDEDEDAPRRSGISRITLDDADDDNDDDEQHAHTNGNGTNGTRETKVKFKDEGAPPASRVDQMRQHLLLLAESQHRFVRHCGTQGRGQWTVDFELLMERIRESELDAIIEQSFGRHGLRLTRILREKGKLDEKMLHSAALMRKPDVQGKMLAMEMAGLVDIQEVPKDSSRMANRTLFFWYFDAERTRSQLLDDIYKAMMRCLQTLQAERHKERNILSFVERKDVQGKEEEVMTAEHYNKYNEHLQIQEKLIAQLMRLDDMVSIFRDF
ncbi:hypothetical protein GMORB2_6327 [Geosmithia morbida]|uniref:DNA-directed RNA polymerase III subunit RPC3 n=1 Tax=Geosmithia morbida TaxID=1094350 RepID=A0A9P4YXM7_9HYPO|nr:uncharacterized protein GMORB2_6327 [Geosmithia morbida]KAF4123626.1 hypothetical protein GMORB2_6327 [Geosmithia morbida]